MPHDASQVAGWMVRTVESNGALSHDQATEEIADLFGEEFIEYADGYAPTVSQKVLKEFLVLTQRRVVWEVQDRVWRLRSPSDPNTTSNVGVGS